MMNLVARLGVIPAARTLAQEYHEGQLYGDEPYYDKHICSVAKRVDRDKRATDYHVAVAYLHDIVEDTKMTSQDLADYGFSPAIIYGVLAVTRNDDETYADFIKRACENRFARLVKYHDLHENLSNPGKPELNKRYWKAIGFIEGYEEGIK